MSKKIKDSKVAASIPSKVRRNIDRFANISRRDGVGSAAYVYFYELFSRFTPFTIYRIMRLRAERLVPDFDRLPRRYHIRALTGAEALEHAEDPRNDMTGPFVRESLENGETCIGVFDGRNLAGYGWYSDRPCHTRAELYFFFGNAYKYQHKGFTYPDYRGQRLHAFGKAYACRLYAQQGYRGLFSIVEAHNLNSLRSNRRMGGEVAGSLYALSIFGRYYTHSDKGARQLNCYLAPKSSGGSRTVQAR